MSFCDFYKLAFDGWPQATGLSDATLHVHAGLIAMSVFSVIVRLPLRSAFLLLLVIAIALAKEFADFVVQGEWKADTLSDIGHTVLWPTVIFFLARFGPGSPSTKGKEARNTQSAQQGACRVHP